MTPAGHVLQVAVTYVWLGMVLAISFLEAPLKFRAPGVSLPLGLGIGRLVFRALNNVEIGLAAVLATLAALLRPARVQLLLLAAVLVVLAVQLLVLRRVLDARAVRVIAGETLPPSRRHLAYIGLEGVKVAMLVALGISATPVAA